MHLPALSLWSRNVLRSLPTLWRAWNREAHKIFTLKDRFRWLAINGWVVPYRDCHCEVIRDAAARAKVAGVGIWSSEFQMPWEWRATDSAKTETQPDAQGRCVIKGNISKSGERIYHVPGNRYYDRTIVDERAGERWFCSESEAIAAGWRPAKV
jgi:hypothetical protein